MLWPATLGVLRAEGATPPGPGPGPFDGRSFAGVMLPLPAQAGGTIEFGADRAWSWRDGVTTRVVLDRDVRIKIGNHRFAARRASAWIEPAPGRPGASQVAVYLDQVREVGPGGAPAPVSGRRQQAERLLVVAVVDDTSPALVVDLLHRERPGTGDARTHADIVAFLGDAEARLSRYLSDVTRPAPEPAPEPAPAPAPPPVAAPPPAAEPAIEPFPARSAVELPREPMPPPVEEPAPVPTRPQDAPPPATPPEPPEPSTTVTRPVLPPEGERVRPPVALIPPTPGIDSPAPLIDTRGPMTPADRPEPIRWNEGVVNLFWKGPLQTIAGPSAGEKSLVLTGGMAGQVQLWDQDRNRWSETIQLIAERAVVFVRADADSGIGRLRAEDVSGLYLEGDVSVTNGRYTLRGSRVYFDIATARAILLDAVFWTYDEKRGMPIYVRAAAIRQESVNQWRAEKPLLANVAFADPHFAVGASSVTITRQMPGGFDIGGTLGDGSADGGGSGDGSAGGGGGLAGVWGPEVRGSSSVDPRDALAGDGPPYIDARDVTFRAGGVPLAYAPALKGEFKTSPLRRAQVDSYTGDTALRTRWDLFTLFGAEAPRGTDLTLDIDGFLERGVGLGPALSWSGERTAGSLMGYYIYDNGEDHMTSGAKIDNDDEHRGMVLGENIWRLTDHWTLFTEGTYISDERFVDAFFESEAETRREFVSSIYARRQADNDMLSIEARTTFNDFVANEYLLQSLGYQTKKLPELRYTLMGESLGSGLLVYTGDARYSRMALSFNEPRLRDQGFDKPRRSEPAFGLQPDDRISDQLSAQGLDEDTVNRFDTRHEVEIPLVAGPVNIVPFAAGRFTAYDTNFDSFNSADNDKYRLWGSGGVRMATSLQKVDNSVRSRFWDVDRVRHIVEPSVTLWHSDATIDQTDLPVYDDEVESLATGTSVRAGVKNTWQTMRGGQGRLRSVDWLVINVDYIWSSGDIDVESPFGRFIESRPEASYLGRFLTTEGVFNVTDSVSLVGGYLLDTEAGTSARTVGGVIIDHGYGLSTYAGLRDLDPIDSTLIDYGARAELTRKHAITAFLAYDLNEERFRSLGGRVTRRFQQWTLDFAVSFDRTADDVNLSLSLRPVGTGSDDRRRVYTRETDEGEPLRAGRALRDGRIDYGPFADD